MAKQVTDRQKAVEIVASAAEHNGRKLQQGVAKLLAPYLKPGEQVPDLALAAALVARLLRDANGKLVAATQQQETAAGVAGGPLDARDGVRDALYTKMTGLRLAVEATYGHAGTELCGFRGLTPTQPAPLLSLAQRSHDLLVDGHIAWPAPLHAGVSMNLQAWARDLEPLLAALGDQLQAAQARKRDVGAATAEKHAAMAVNDDAFLRGAQWLEATLRLAGEAELAEQVRPSHHHPGLTGQQAAPAPSPAVP